MYICTDCRAVFEEPRRVKEVHNELPEKLVEYFYECPVCGSSGLEEAEKCECGAAMVAGEACCEDCKLLLKRSFGAFLADLTEGEKEYLLELIEM